MPRTAQSLRQQQRELSRELRARQLTWAQVAGEFCDRYGVNIRTALRMVRDWSQRDAAEQWNTRWPADPKNFKNFSYWELWPGPTGYSPSLDVLARLAELYECSVADLVSDCADFRKSDHVYRDVQQLADLPGVLSLAPDASMTAHSGIGSHRELHELVARLEEINVHELARLTSIWSERLGAVASRRELLLKLSAGLSLAAASPALAEEGPQSAATLGSSSGDYSGIWHSRYVYPSTGRSEHFTGEHFVILKQQGHRLVGQSIQHSTGSELRLELAIDQPFATGSWREATSPTGYYKGAHYHGTLQLVAEPNGQRMRGMWLGFGRDFTINSGEWELELKDRSTGRNAQRPFEQAV